MAITYTWDITDMEVLPQHEGLNNVVASVSFEYTGTAGDGVTSTIAAAIPFESVDADDFTEYNNLTKDQVLGWVKQYIDIPSYNAVIEHEIKTKRKPTPVSKALPWE